MWVGGFGAGKQGQLDLPLSGSAFSALLILPSQQQSLSLRESTQQELKKHVP